MDTGTANAIAGPKAKFFPRENSKLNNVKMNARNNHSMAAIGEIAPNAKAGTGESLMSPPEPKPVISMSTMNIPNTTTAVPAAQAKSHMSPP